MGIYLGLFANQNDVEKEFGSAEVMDYDILFAAYTFESWSGDALVIARKDGKIFEIEGGHCSCYGLEGQWSPTEVNIQYLLNRLQSSYKYDQYRQEIRAVLEAL